MVLHVGIGARRRLEVVELDGALGVFWVSRGRGETRERRMTKKERSTCGLSYL